jgi:hypothetical protein
MSRITDVLVVIGPNHVAERALPAINKFFEGFAEEDDAGLAERFAEGQHLQPGLRIVPNHIPGGSKYMMCTLLAGGINYLNETKFLAYLRALPWKVWYGRGLPYVQALLHGEDDDGFRVVALFPGAGLESYRWGLTEEEYEFVVNDSLAGQPQAGTLSASIVDLWPRLSTEARIVAYKTARGY